MPRPAFFRVGSLALVLTALAACNDQTTSPTPLQASSQDANALAICGPACSIGNPGGGIIILPPFQFYGISSLTLADNTIPIGGTPGTYTATLFNNTTALSGVVLQGWMVQGSTRRAAGGTSLNCGAGSGVLPSGGCTMSFSAVASNTTSGTGTLIPGVATFELDMTVGSSTITKTIGVNLIPGAFTASGDVTFSLSGALNDLTTTITNAGSQTYGSYSYQINVIQGSAHRSAGSTPLACPGAGWGNLPGNTTCTQKLYASVSNNNSGSGTLVAGFATMQVQLLHGGSVISTVTYAMSIVDVRLSSVVLDPTPVVLGGPVKNGTYTITTAGYALVHNGVGVIGYIHQGSTIRGVEGDLTHCVAGNDGSLPIGPCTGTVRYAAQSYSGPDGQLAPGPAMLAVVVRGLNVTLDSINYPITIVP